MVDVDRAVIAKIKKEGKNFEILVDCDKALEYRKGKAISLGDVVATGDVFKDVKQGEKASEHDLEDIFGTSDPMKVASIIIKEGEVQLTTAHKSKLREEIRKQVIDMIRVNAVDPTTGHPHPPKRIELAMEQAKVNVVEHKKAEEQFEDVLNALKPILPIRIESKNVEVKIPAKYASAAFFVLKKYGKLLSDKWESNGSLSAKLEMPAGLVDEFFGQLNKITKGEIESKIS